MKAKPILYFDASCGFCNQWVGVIRRLDRHGQLQLEALQSIQGQELVHSLSEQKVDTDTVILQSDDGLYLRSDAVIHCLLALGSWYRWVLVFKLIPRTVRDYLYRVIARNRHRLGGRKDVCGM
jgi:predicted DCC family thiol-disulfide oxidoreductase YuxK